MDTNGNLQVDLTFANDVVKTANITITVNGADKTTSAKLDGASISGSEKLSGKHVLTLAGVRDDANVVVSVKNFADATNGVSVTAVSAGSLTGNSAASISAVAAAQKKVGETVSIVVDTSDTSLTVDQEYTLTVNGIELKAKAEANNKVTFTYTVTTADVLNASTVALTATEIA